jgi:glycosyltransferase involved in cell wall biosynthesis
VTTQRPILLYQPYCDQIGHFKDFHAIWRSYLESQQIPVLSVLGTTEITSDETTVVFANTSANRMLQIIRTVSGLRMAFAQARRSRARAIYIQDFEIATYSLTRWLFGWNVPAERICLHQHAGNFNTTAADSVVMRLYRTLTRRLYINLLRDPRVRIIANGSNIASELRTYTRHVNDDSVIDSNWGTKVGSEVSNTPSGAKSSQNYPKKRNTFLFAGIIRSDKNLEYLLEEFAQLSEGEAHLLIAGIPFDYTSDEIEAFIRKVDIPPANITFRPAFFSTDEWSEMFREYEFIVIPYRASNQSSSGPLIDALQFNCIPIVSDYGERGYITRAYNIGLCFNFDQKPLRSVLKQVTSADYDRTEYLRRIETIKNQFTWSYILNDLTHQKAIFNA